MIVVDPRVTKTAMIADVHLAVRPRGDVTLLNGILRVLLDEGLRRPRRPRRPHVDGLDELLAHLRGLDRRARAADECGIAARADPRASPAPSGGPSAARWPGRWA